MSVASTAGPATAAVDSEQPLSAQQQRKQDAAVRIAARVAAQNSSTVEVS